MERIDRLNALINRFAISVRPCAPETADLLISQGTGEAGRWTVHFGQGRPLKAAGAVVFSAKVEWGGADNPLLNALPKSLDYDVTEDNEVGMLLQLLIAESEAMRCGAESVLNRLGEVLIVRIIRNAIQNGAAEPGLIGALADPRLSRAIVAMHENPGRNWRSEDLAEVAALSRSRFVELFTQAVGEAPSVYLRRWRLTLAKREIERGERVDAVARRYAYRSGEALNRAFHRRYGVSPSALRRRGQTQEGHHADPVSN